jgi:hypothetical protein
VAAVQEEMGVGILGMPRSPIGHITYAAYLDLASRIPRIRQNGISAYWSQEYIQRYVDIMVA